MGYGVFWSKKPVKNDTQIWSHSSGALRRQLQAEIPLETIRTCIEQWPERLRCCIEKEGGHFE